VANNPQFAEIANTFGDLPSAMGYFASLPDRPILALRRLIRTPTFPKSSVSKLAAAANDGASAGESRAA
jgi:hypothetical protein